MLHLGIALLFYAMLSSCFIILKPKIFFDKQGMPYNFGLTSKENRPYSLFIVFMCCAITSYYLTVMFYTQIS